MTSSKVTGMERGKLLKLWPFDAVSAFNMQWDSCAGGTRGSKMTS